MSFKVNTKIKEEPEKEVKEKSSTNGYMDKNTYIAKINGFSGEVEEINHSEIFNKEEKSNQKN